MRVLFKILSVGMLLCETPLLFAQVADAPPAAPPAAAPAPKPASSFLGKDIPFLDPGSDVLTWDGKNWNVNNNRVFQGRFEKYLNAPEETSTQDKQYQAIISEVLSRLAPSKASTQNIDAAFRLLARGSGYDVDARLCESLADAVYTVWSAQRQQQRLTAANEALQFEIIAMEARARVSGRAAQSGRQPSPSSKSGAQPPPPAASIAGEAKEAGLEVNNWQTRGIVEMVARQKANIVKRELSEIQAKLEFQALILQLFLQRRFQHVLMSTRFYRSIFSDGDTKLNVGKDTQDLFSRSSGLPPTIGTLDSLANEAVRDVRESVRAFEFLLESNELESATKRLGEAFIVGEHLPEIRALPRTRKRKALEFAQKSNQLISAIEVKDYTLAEKLVKALGDIAKDFDNSKPMAAIETARQLSQFRLAKARNAAISGDRQTLEQELAAATELWPRNPALAEVAKTIFEQGDVQQNAVIDFDRLRSQKNYRQIYENNARFIAATALYPDRQTQLQEILKSMQTVETAIMRAEEMRRQSNYAGAWESVEKIATDFPEDSKLNQVRADLTTQAADFVRTVRGAQDLEKRDQVGSSLAWYLKAQKLYPASDMAQDGISRLTKRVLPDG